MKRLLEGKVAIVTGAGRGIGRAEALTMAQLQQHGTWEPLALGAKIKAEVATGVTRKEAAMEVFAEGLG